MPRTTESITYCMGDWYVTCVTSPDQSYRLYRVCYIDDPDLRIGAVDEVAAKRIADCLAENAL